MINASLGAHYSNSFVGTSIKLFWQTLLGSPETDNHRHNLRQKLEGSFGGRAALVYKGRDAIELALRAYGLTNSADVVLTQAFSCFAIEEAIVRAGATPVYVDVGNGQLNLTVATLERARKQHGKNVKAVIVQNSLGHPADMTAIAHWCTQHSILLIEDLAQSFGATADDQRLGTFGDAVVLSFGRDKIIDAVTGGVVVFRTSPANFPTVFPAPPKLVVLKDLAYPFFTWLIRATYDVLLGKIIHKLLTLLRVMTNPTQAPTQTITALPESFAQLALFQLAEHAEVHARRQTISALYLEGLADTPLKFLTQKSHISTGSLLRVAATVEDPQPLLNTLKFHNIHLTDRWYRAPVDCGQLKCETHYKNDSCPNAEKLAATIINLPTHRKMTIRQTVKIIAVIQKFYAK